MAMCWEMQIIAAQMQKSSFEIVLQCENRRGEAHVKDICQKAGAFYFLTIAIQGINTYRFPHKILTHVVSCLRIYAAFFALL